MNKKLFGIAFVIMLLVTTVTIILINNKKNLEKKTINDIAIMVYDENKDSYVSSSTIPKGSYILNREKTKCMSGGEVNGYDSTNGTVSYSLDSPDSCKLYFDKETYKTLLVEISGIPTNCPNDGVFSLNGIEYNAMDTSSVQYKAGDILKWGNMFCDIISLDSKESFLTETSITLGGNETQFKCAHSNELCGGGIIIPDDDA